MRLLPEKAAFRQKFGLPYRPVRAMVVMALLMALLQTWMPEAIWASNSMPSVRGVDYVTAGPNTRIIVHLTGLPQDLVVDNRDRGQMTLAFTGHLSSGIQPRIKRFSYPNLSQVYFERVHGDRVQFFIKRTTPGTGAVTFDSQTGSLVITVPNRPVTRQTVADGVRYARWTEKTSRGPIRINMLEINPMDPRLEILPVLADGRMGTKSRVVDMVERLDGLAGINASFFKQDVGIPLGTLIINRELVAGPLFNRVTMGISKDGRIQMDQLALHGTVTLPDGEKLAINNINQPRIRLDQVVLYTSRWGKTAPGVPKNGYQVQLVNGRVTAVSTSSPVEIPANGYVVSGPGIPMMDRLARLSPEEPVGFHFYTLPDWSHMKHAIAGGPYLVRNGHVYVDAGAQHFTRSSLGTFEPRSAAGVTRDGRLLLVTVDGRQRRSVGVSLHEMARLMRQLGAVEAMNLDGGSSTQMVVNDRVVNSPTIRNGAAVSSGLVVRYKPVAAGPVHATAVRD